MTRRDLEQLYRDAGYRYPCLLATLERLAPVLLAVAVLAAVAAAHG